MTGQMHRQIIQQYNVTGPHLRQQQLVDVGVEERSINRATDAQRRADTAQPQRTNDRHIHATLMRDRLRRPCAPASAPRESRQRQMEASFINKQPPLARQLCNLLAKQLSGLLVPFGSRKTLFLRGSPKRCQARHTVAGCTVTCSCSAKCNTNSASVESFFSATRACNTVRCFSESENATPPPRGFGCKLSPQRWSLKYLATLHLPMSKRAATSSKVPSPCS